MMYTVQRYFRIANLQIFWVYNVGEFGLRPGYFVDLLPTAFSKKPPEKANSYYFSDPYASYLFFYQLYRLSAIVCKDCQKVNAAYQVVKVLLFYFFTRPNHLAVQIC